MEAVMAEDKPRRVRSPAGRPRRKPREITWEEMTDHQRWLVKAGEAPGIAVPPGMTLEQFREFLRGLPRKV